MNTLAIQPDPHAVDVAIDNDALHFILADGREITAPLAWFPCLRDASETQRKAGGSSAKASASIGRKLTKTLPSKP